MKAKIVITLILLIMFTSFLWVYHLFYSPISGVATAQSLNDSVDSYVWAKFIRDGGVETSSRTLLILAVLIVWVWPKKNMTTKQTVGLLLCAALFTGCKPVKVLDVVEIAPNETAWAIPLDAQSQGGQVKFNSVDFLNQKKVAAKRIMVDKVQRSIGRMYWDIEWLPSTRVIRVDRSLVTRKWADKEDIGVVTKDSVKLRVGLTITASIDEDDASTYLYYHGERPLDKVLDQNIRSFAEAELTKEYSQLTLGQAQVQGNDIYAKLFEDARAAFKEKGIKIQYLGNAEGLNYADAKVQESINQSYTAQQDAKTAEMEQNAQKIRNQTKIMTTLALAQAEQQAQEVRNALKIKTSEAEAQSAKNLLAVKEAAAFQNELAISLLVAEAQMKMASVWDGKMPLNILPNNSPLLLNLGAK